jgi:predicted phage-related endonuclease
MAIEQFPIEPRQAWLEHRKQDVTASVIAALWSAHPWMTPLKLHYQKRGVEFDDEDSGPKRRGRWFESGVAKGVAEERPQWQLEPNQFYYRDPEKRLGATPDYFIHGDPRGLGVLQCKTAAPTVFNRDWHDASEPPFWIILQALTEAMLTDAQFIAVAAANFNAWNPAVKIFEIERRPIAEQKIVSAVAQFWDDVALGREPDPDYAKGDAQLLKLIVPRELAGKAIDLSGDNELPALLEQHREIAEQIKLLKDRKTIIEAQVQFRMRDAEKVTGLPGWSISWKTSERPEYTVEAQSVRTLRIIKRKDKA